MKHEKRELQKAVEQLEKERDYFDQQIWEKEMQYAKKHEEVSFKLKHCISRVCVAMHLRMLCNGKQLAEKNLVQNLKFNLVVFWPRGVLPYISCKGIFCWEG